MVVSGHCTVFQHSTVLVTAWLLQCDLLFISFREYPLRFGYLLRKATWTIWTWPLKRTVMVLDGQTITLVMVSLWEMRCVCVCVCARVCACVRACVVLYVYVFNTVITVCLQCEAPILLLASPLNSSFIASYRRLSACQSQLKAVPLSWEMAPGELVVSCLNLMLSK